MDLFTQCCTFFHTGKKIIVLGIFLMNLEKKFHVKTSLFCRYKSARLFGRNLSVWDFFLKVTMDFDQSLPHLYQSASNQNSPMASPRRGHNTLESPKKLGQGLSMAALLESPKRSLGGKSHPNVPPGATLSRSNQFRRYIHSNLDITNLNIVNKTQLPF